ncbi:MAG TPA: AbiV family abortive infection protein [Paenisporosarcina sp.]|nr:AbiV family abortive infection protein [Paenisporosarcina sp.]
MKNSYYWINKFDGLSGICFENSLRLHFDSIRLFKGYSYASALALSILSMEELAKAHLIENLVMHAIMDKTPIAISWDELQKENVLISHRIKQRVFINRAFLPKWHNEKGKLVRNNLSELVHSGELEVLKQKAFYVGLSSKSSRKGNQRIENPLSITQKTPKKIITTISDYLIDLVVGVIHENYIIDTVSMESKMDKKLLRRLMRAWPHRGRVGIRAIKLHTTLDI